jgi:DNA-binding MarR family transcriptional regulator
MVDDEPRWLTPEELHAWKGLMALVMTLPPAIDAQLRRDSGLNTFEYHVLAGLSGAPNHRLPMVDLAAIAQGSPSRLSHAVSRLERDGLVERTTCYEAGRRTAARLTRAGLRVLEKAAPHHVAEARRLVVDTLTPEELRVLGEVSRKIVSVTDPHLTATLLADEAAPA